MVHRGIGIGFGNKAILVFYPQTYYRNETATEAACCGIQGQ
jgi:hypothetical protein